MPTKDTSAHSNELRRSRIGEILRFGIVGTAATAVQYAVYWTVLHVVAPGVAMTVGYVVSFVFNFLASTRYTFRVRPNASRGAGFALSHVVNYVLQMVMLALFLHLGVAERWAPLPVFAVCVPVNFVLVRFFLKRGVGQTAGRNKEKDK